MVVFKSTLHPRLSINSSSTAIWNRDSSFQVAIDVHQAPLIFPFLAWLVKPITRHKVSQISFKNANQYHQQHQNLRFFPGLIIGGEPKVIRPISQRRTYPILQESIHLWNSSDTPLGTSRRSTTTRTPSRRPADLGNDMFRLVRLQRDIVILPKTPRPTCTLLGDSAREERMDISHHVINLIC